MVENPPCAKSFIARDIEEACQQLEAMLARGIEVFAVWPSLGEAIRSAPARKLTAYDTLYLDLARRQRLTLAALDTTLRTTAQSAGVQLIV